MITKIEIENYKSIKKMDLALRPINVLIGANGAGKSNFISFFKFVRHLYEGRLQYYTAQQGRADNMLYLGNKESSYIQSKITFDNINAYSFRLAANNEDHFFFEEEATETLENNTWIKIASQKHGSESLICQYGGANFQQAMASFQVFHFHDTSETSRIGRTCDIHDNAYLREKGENLAAYLYWLQVKYPQTFRKIELAVRAIAPYFDAFSLQPDRLNAEKIRLEWREKNADKYFNAVHLSDGTIRFIALTALLALSPLKENSTIQNHTSLSLKNQIIIIDEPELGLHPAALPKLAAMLQSAADAGKQIIIATQSAALINYFSPEDVITVDRKDRTGQTIFTRHDSENLNLWLENYSLGEIWQKNVIGGRP